MPKAQRTQGLPAFTKRTAFKSYHKLVKIQPQNLNQTSASNSRPNFWNKMLVNLKPQNLNFCLKILTKLQLQNLDQISASKSWAKIYIKIWIKLQLQYCDQKQDRKALPNLSFKISTKLLSTHSSASTSAALTTSRSFESASSKARVTSVNSTKH